MLVPLSNVENVVVLKPVVSLTSFNVIAMSPPSAAVLKFMDAGCDVPVEIPVKRISTVVELSSFLINFAVPLTLLSKIEDTT